jgi:hypothetical protein
MNQKGIRIVVTGHWATTSQPEVDEEWQFQAFSSRKNENVRF